MRWLLAGIFVAALIAGRLPVRGQAEAPVVVGFTAVEWTVKGFPVRGVQMGNAYILLSDGSIYRRKLMEDVAKLEKAESGAKVPLLTAKEAEAYLKSAASWAKLATPTWDKDDDAPGG